jgi:hypothetical protein
VGVCMTVVPPQMVTAKHLFDYRAGQASL